VVLLNAASGEILALASSPTFDPERLDEEWEEKREDPAAPLVNRATQGLYQPGTALQTVIIAEVLTQGLADLSAPTSHGTATLSINGTMIGCSVTGSDPRTLADAYTAACPAPFADLGERLGSAGLEEAIGRWALTTTPPPLEIPTEAADWSAEGLTSTSALRAEAIGQGSLTVSPLQMASMAGTLANLGKMVVPRLVLRVQDANEGWREQVSTGEPRDVLPPRAARALLAAWQHYGENVAAHWGVAIAGEGRPPHTWFIGVTPRAGTTDEPHYAIAVLIEHAAAPEVAVRIGTALLEAAAAQWPGE